jgi:hypothetical protein
MAPLSFVHAFALTARVPADGGAPWTVEGSETRIEIQDAPPPADAGPTRPWVLRSRFTLRSGSEAAFFHIDRSVMAALRADDAVHIARSGRGGLGISVVRGPHLVMAAGVVTAVPLGDVRARIAADRQREAIADLRPPLGVRGWNAAELYAHELPLELWVGGREHLDFHLNGIIGDFEAFMVHGRREPGPDECVALSRLKQCSPIGARASALLLAADGLRAV